MSGGPRTGAGDDLGRLEREGWVALSTSGHEARRFYEEVLDDEAVMLLPGGMVLDDREAILESMSGQPWERFELEDVRVLRPLPDAAVVAYGATASRGGQPYSASISSMYVRREEGWRLVFHQQTPR